MVSFVGSAMSPAVHIWKSSSDPSSSFSYMKTSFPNSDLGKPFLVRSLTNRKDKGTVCACVAPPRDYKAADSNRFPNTRFNQESAKSENVSLSRESEDESDVLIECRNVCKSFGDKHILRAGLDPIASTVVEDLIRSVHVTGKDALGKPGNIASYVVVTHQHSTIRRAVDRLIFLYEGKVVWQGMTHEFSTSANPIVRQFASGSLDGPIRY